MSEPLEPRFSEKEESKILAYLRVFDNPEGREVLTDILRLLKFHGKINTMEDAALHNAGLAILERCGVWYEDNAFDITDELMKLSLLTRGRK